MKVIAKGKCMRAYRTQILNFGRTLGRAFMMMVMVGTSVVPQSLAVTGTVTSDIGVNIRSEPRGTIMTAVPMGSTFEILSKNGKWLHVRLPNGRTGFVWNPGGVNVAGADSVSAATPGSEVVPAVVGGGADVPIPVPRPTDIASNATQYVANGNFNLRSGPGTGNRILSTLSGGRSQFTILEREGRWLKVKTSDGKIGYIHNSGATEASACVNGECARPSANPARDDAAAIVAAIDREAPASRNMGCYQRELLKAAKSVARSKYGNRPHSGGKCALGVRQMLDRAGMNNGVGLGHAIDFHSRGRLTQKGFVNRISRYPTADKAPPGAILVFSGPKTNQYLRNGRMARPYGDYVGHVAIKGDDGKYYTDARTSYPAIRNRFLVGVYVMENPSRLPAAARRKCQ